MMHLRCREKNKRKEKKTQSSGKKTKSDIMLISLSMRIDEIQFNAWVRYGGRRRRRVEEQCSVPNLESEAGSGAGSGFTRRPESGWGLPNFRPPPHSGSLTAKVDRHSMEAVYV